MNLRNFLLQVDTISGQMSASQLQAFIHETARLLSESKRFDYLDTLKSFLSEPQSDAMDVIKNKSKLSEEFEKECIRLQKELFKIEEGELYLQSEPNYEYDEWYDNDDEEVFFRDPHGVGNVIKAVCQYLHRCVDCEE